MKKTMANKKTMELFMFLRSLPLMNLMDHDDMQFSVVTGFFKILGYNEDEIFFDVNIGMGKPVYADVVIADDRAATPSIVIEVKIEQAAGKQLSSVLKKIWKKQLNEYTVMSGAKTAVFFSGSRIIIQDDGDFKEYSLAELREEQVEEIQRLLEKKSGHAKNKKRIKSIV